MFMKRIFLISVATLLISAVSMAQFNSGGFYFSGSTNANLGFENSSDELGSSSNSICFGLNPEAGYFIKNRLAVGGAIFTDYELFLNDFGNYSEYSIVFGPNVRYYLPRDTDMQVFLYGFAGYGFVPDHNLFQVMLGPGINLFLTERVAFESKLLYTYQREWSTIGSGFHNNHSVTILVGISLFFPTFSFETFRRDPAGGE